MTPDTPNWTGIVTSVLLINQQGEQLLWSMVKTEWVQYLPTGGTGTLRNRFRGSGGVVKAKTGSLTGVNSLSGYVFPKRYPGVFIFSIINNGASDVDFHVMHNATDAIVTAMIQCDTQ